MCSCRARPRSCTPTSTRSTPRSSSETILVSSVARSSWGRESCLPPATRPRPRRSDGDGWCAGPAAVPAGGGRAAPDVGVRRGKQGGVRGVRADDAAGRGALDRRGVPRCSRTASGSRARRPRSPRGCGARSASASACPSRSGWPAPSSWPRWRAEWPSLTGCWWCRPAASSAFCTRFRWNGCGAWARSPPGSCRKGAWRPSGRWPKLAEAALVSMLGQAAGRHLHALAHNRDPRRVRGGRRRRSIGAQRALGRSPRSWNDLDAVLVGLVDRLARRLRAARRVCRTVTLRLRFDDFSRATRSHTLPEATAQTQTILATAEGCWPRPCR